MSKWNMIVDVAKCMNCHNCTLSNKDEHVGNRFPGYAAPQPLHGHSWIKIERYVRAEDTMVDVTYRPTMCNHCDNAPCLKAGGDAVKKRDDGIVIIDPDKAKGRRDLVESCPYGAIWWNEAENVPQIWIFDAHLLDQGWSQPRCVQSCPTNTFKAIKVEDEEMRAIAVRENLQRPREELGTEPRVYYKNWQRYAACFLGGSVTTVIDGKIECVADAKIVLEQGGKALATQHTDAFGDFKFDGLDPNSGTYRIHVSHPQFGATDLSADLGTDSRHFANLRL